MAKEIWRPGNMLYPAPPVMVSCGRVGEKPNIITVAWAGTICSDPAMLSISVRKERFSHSIIKETGEFVVNLTSSKLAYAADLCGVRSGRDYDKFKEMKLTPLQSQKISAPGIAEAPVNIECKVKQILELGTHDMFIAEVVSVSVDDKLLDDNGRLDLGKAGLVSYCHGEYYSLGEKLGKFGYSVARKHSQGQKKTADKQGTKRVNTGFGDRKKAAKSSVTNKTGANKKSSVNKNKKRNKK